MFVYRSSLVKKRGITLGPASVCTLIAAIIIYGTITPIIGKLSLVNVSSITGRHEDLTGRTLVWEQVVPFAMQHTSFRTWA